MESHSTAFFLLAIGILLTSAKACGTLATRLRQPTVVGEIMAGILLGPTLLGRIAQKVLTNIDLLRGGGVEGVVDALKGLLK